MMLILGLDIRVLYDGCVLLMLKWVVNVLVDFCECELMVMRLSFVVCRLDVNVLVMLLVVRIF